jgi:ATP-binding cassette subfamily B protein RaxB
MIGAAGGAPFTIGMLFAFIAYKTQFTGRAAGLISHGVELKMLALHAERLADIALHRREHDVLPECDLAHLQPSLELRGVSFRYGEGEPWVLHHANLVVRAGECVALTGVSGAGKTTVIKILLGLLEPVEGEVLYGDVPVRQLGLGNFRRRIGTVLQDDTLLTGSLADNICFFDAQPDLRRVEACAKLAQVHEEIVRMPMGYHTLVGDLGIGLSGGQKQRLLLARALYKQPRVLVLDEATSHLDIGTERAVTCALIQMRMTRLVIAHRPETIAGSQRVVQLKNGLISEVMRAVSDSRVPPVADAPPAPA